MTTFYSFSAKAAVDESQVGPRGPVGPQIEVGPQGPVGPQSPTANSQAMTAPVSGSLTADLSNGQTGPNSDNVNAVNKTNNTDATLTNDAKVDNQDNLALNSGKNSVDTNSVVGGIKTGDINGSVNVLNLANTTLAPDSSVGVRTVDGAKTGEIVLASPIQRSSLSNSTTGSESSNLNAVNNNNIVKIIDSNNAAANNDLNIKANTGLNTIFGNTQVGNITTGDINLATNLINLLNVFEPNLTLTLDIWSIMGGFMGDLIFDPSVSNSSTGPESQNQNTVDRNSAANIGVAQKAAVNNNLSYDTNTGQNDIGMSTVVGNVVTGVSTVNSSTTNIANAGTPMLYLVNVFGSWDGELQGIDPNLVIVNRMTGPQSDNTNAVNDNSQTGIQIDNNASAGNKVNISANTGKNMIGNNTAVGDIKTGAINLSNNVINVLNSFGQDLSKIKISIVNIFGNWRGNGKTKPDNQSGDNSGPGGENQNQGGENQSGGQNQVGGVQNEDSSAASSVDSTNSAGTAAGPAAVLASAVTESDKQLSDVNLSGEAKGSLGADKIIFADDLSGGDGSVENGSSDQIGMLPAAGDVEPETGKKKLPALPMALGALGLALAGAAAARRKSLL